MVSDVTIQSSEVLTGCMLVPRPTVPILFFRLLLSSRKFAITCTNYGLVDDDQVRVSCQLGEERNRDRRSC